MMSVLKFFSSVIAAGLLVFPVQAEDLFQLLGPVRKIFNQDRARFINTGNQYFFAWNSAEKTEVRYPAMPGRILTCFGFRTQEVIIRFQDESVSSIYISIYNRGDAGNISWDKMVAMLRQLDQNIQKSLPQIRPVNGKSKLRNDAVINTRTWKGADFTYILTYSSSGKRKNQQNPEYIHINIVKTDHTSFQTGSKITDKVVERTRTMLFQFVKKDARGNVWIDGIPMVNQGEKGYCCVAVLERVFRYYGYPVTQHTFAQLAGSSAVRGTNITVMVKALQDTAGKFGVRVREIFAFGKNAQDIELLVNAYNKQARKAKKPKISLVIRGNMIYIDETLNQMDYEIFKKMRLTDHSNFRRFTTNIHSRTDAGLPTLWGVQLGLEPEEKLNPQTRGGHLRLIIGYNDKTNEIIYSDTWGTGHERKSMPIERAWVITRSVFAVDPRR